MKDNEAASVRVEKAQKVAYHIRISIKSLPARMVFGLGLL